MKNVLSKSQDLDELEPDHRIDNDEKTQQQNQVNDHAPDLGVSMAEEPISPARKSKSERPQFIGTSFVVENKVNEWLERNEKQNEQAKVPDEDLEKDYLKARIIKKHVFRVNVSIIFDFYPLKVIQRRINICSRQRNFRRP